MRASFEKPCNKPHLGEVNATNMILRCSSLITSYSFNSINLTEIHHFLSCLSFRPSLTETFIITLTFSIYGFPFVQGSTKTFSIFKHLKNVTKRFWEFTPQDSVIPLWNVPKENKINIIYKNDDSRMTDT